MDKVDDILEELGFRKLNIGGQYNTMNDGGLLAEKPMLLLSSSHHLATHSPSSFFSLCEKREAGLVYSRILNRASYSFTESDDFVKVKDEHGASLSGLYRHLANQQSLFVGLSQDYRTLQSKHETLEKLCSEIKSKLEFANRENEILTNKLSEQILLRSSIQSSKEEMTEELEELTRSLFEEANKLVSNESRQRHEAEFKCQKLSEELELTKLRLADEICQLKELKEKMKVYLENKTTVAVSTTLPPLNFTTSTTNLGQNLFIPYKHATDLSSIWHYLSLRDMEDITPENFDEYEKVYFYEPDIDKLLKSIMNHHQPSIMKTATQKPLNKKAGAEDPNEQSFVDFLSRERNVSLTPGSFESSRSTSNTTLRTYDSIESYSSQLLHINPRWIAEHFDSSLYNEFIQFISRSEDEKKLPSPDSGLNDMKTSTSLPSIMNIHSTVLAEPSSAYTAKSIHRPLTPKFSPFKGIEKAITFRKKIKSIKPILFYNSLEPFMKKIYEEDISPTLSFPLKTKAFIKKILKALSDNHLSIEAMPADFNLTSDPNSASPTRSVATTILVIPEVNPAVSPGPPDVALEDEAPPQPTSERRSYNFGFRPLKTTESEDETKSSSDSSQNESAGYTDGMVKNEYKCALCGKFIKPFSLKIISHENQFPSLSAHSPSGIRNKSREPVRHILRLSDDAKAKSYIIDSHCQKKIVSVCDFFTFIKYCQQGLFQSLSKEQLFCKFLHIRRAMFYAKIGASIYFVISDTSCLLSSWNNGRLDWNEKLLEAVEHAKHETENDDYGAFITANASTNEESGV